MSRYKKYPYLSESKVTERIQVFEETINSMIDKGKHTPMSLIKLIDGFKKDGHFEVAIAIKQVLKKRNLN